MRKNNNLIHFHHLSAERGGVVVEHWTPNREVQGSIPTGGTMLCHNEQGSNGLTKIVFPPLELLIHVQILALFIRKLCLITMYEPPHGKTNNLHMQKQSTDQLRCNREADQRLCFRYTYCTLPLLLKSEISSFLLSSVTVQAGLCPTCSETTLLVFP